MEQKFIFYLLSIVTLIIVTYQYFEYLKTIETFTIQEINGNIIIEPKTKIKIGKKNTENDAVINSAGVLRVDEIRIGNKILDENKFKRLKSFAKIHRMESERGDKLCLKDKNGAEVCCNKEQLGILTGQTPFNLKLADKKLRPSINKTAVDVDDIEYPEMTAGFIKSNNNSLFYDKKFVMLPYYMEEITGSASKLYDDPLVNTSISGILPTISNALALILAPLFSNASKSVAKSIIIPADSLMTKVPRKNYFCNIENKSPQITLSNYELKN